MNSSEAVKIGKQTGLSSRPLGGEGKSEGEMGFPPAGQRGQPSFEVLTSEAGVLMAPRSSTTSKPPREGGLRGMLSHIQSQSHGDTAESLRDTQ